MAYTNIEADAKDLVTCGFSVYNTARQLMMMFRVPYVQAFEIASKAMNTYLDEPEDTDHAPVSDKLGS